MTDEPNRLRVMADDAATKIEELKSERAGLSGRQARRIVNQRISMLREMERWIRTRAGYR